MDSHSGVSMSFPNIPSEKIISVEAEMVICQAVELLGAENPKIMAIFSRAFFMKIREEILRKINEVHFKYSTNMIYYDCMETGSKKGMERSRAKLQQNIVNLRAETKINREDHVKQVWETKTEEG